MDIVQLVFEINGSPVLLKSRKFLVLALDMAISLVLYFVTTHAVPSAAEDVRTVIVARQPVVLAQIGKGIAAYRQDGGVAVLFPDAVTFEVHMRGTFVASVSGQPDTRLLFTIQTADPEFKAPPYPDSERRLIRVWVTVTADVLCPILG